MQKSTGPMAGAGEGIAGNNNTGPISTPSRQSKQVMTRTGGSVTPRLYIGDKATGITLHPDPHWPGMWRVQDGHHGAGRHDHASDILSLTRAKDAAIGWARPRAEHLDKGGMLS